MKYVLENDMIDLSYVRAQIEMKEREEYLSMHPYKISHGSDGNWRTYIPDETHPKGRRQIKKSTLKEVENAIIKHYRKLDARQKPKTFDENYKRWRIVQDEMVSDNTVRKYNTDYKRYFEGTEFTKRKIETITEEDIKVFIVQLVKHKKLCKKACKTLFGYINNTMKSALINKVIVENPMMHLEAKMFYKYCEDTLQTPEKRTVPDNDMDKLYYQFKADYQKKPNYIPTYAVHLATLTGMRVGELAALSWDCITDTYILINKSEKYNRTQKEYYIDKTKNGKVRTFPITDEIKKLLDSIKSIEMQHGYMCEWVFANEEGRIHTSMISSCMKNKCRQVGIPEKGIHALRRTVNSKLRCNGVSATVAASLLGHSEEVNEQYYTYDITSMYDKLQIVDAINKKAM